MWNFSYDTPFVKKIPYKFTALYGNYFMISCIKVTKQVYCWKRNTSRNSENPVLREDREAVIMIQGKITGRQGSRKLQEIFLLLSTEKTCMIGENLLNF